MSNVVDCLLMFQEGEVVVSARGDPCKNLTCLRSEETSELVLHETVETCNKDCPLVSCGTSCEFCIPYFAFKLSSNLYEEIFR